MTSVRLNTVHDGGRYFEGPRWHAGRLWFVDCMERTLLSLAPSGECEQHAKFDDDTPCGLGILPDGRLIVLNVVTVGLVGKSREAKRTLRPARTHRIIESSPYPDEHHTGAQTASLPIPHISLKVAR